MGQLMKLLHFRSATLQNGARSETRTHKPGAGTRSLVWRVFLLPPFVHMVRPRRFELRTSEL